MKKSNPLVSVLMPFYDNGTDDNRAKFSLAVESILGQDFVDFEIVIVASGEKEFARRLSKKSKKIRLYEFEQTVIPKRSIPLKEKLHGIITARNICLEKARGKYIAYADFDDLSMRSRLEKQTRFLNTHPKVGAVGSSMIMIDGEGKPLGIRSAPETDDKIRARFLQFNPMPQPSIMARKELVLRVGGYKTGEIPEDYDLWVRMAKITRFHNLQEPLVSYRIHPGGGASNYKFELFFGSLRVKFRAMRNLGLRPGVGDLFINLYQFASLFFPNSIRMIVLERVRSKIIIGA